MYHSKCGGQRKPAGVYFFSSNKRVPGFEPRSLDLAESTFYLMIHLASPFWSISKWHRRQWTPCLNSALVVNFLTAGLRRGPLSSSPLPCFLHILYTVGAVSTSILKPPVTFEGSSKTQKSNTAILLIETFSASPVSNRMVSPPPLQPEVPRPFC